jgi:hypothetical protein
LEKGIRYSMFIFTEENIKSIKNVVYSNDSIPDKHVKKIEGIKDGLFKDFNYSKYKVKNPPKNNSMVVYNELEYPKELVESLIKSAAGIILDLKYHYNRPRPFQLSSHYNIKLGEKVLESMKTPSYPSGHSVQGILVGKVLQTKLPINTDAFLEAGKRISYSRNLGRAHYPSDSRLGEDIGDAMYRHIRDKF